MSEVIPVVLARELAEAEQALRQAGVTVIEVRTTAPPARSRPGGPWRVVRQRTAGRTARLVVAASVALPSAGATEEAGNG